MEEPVSDMTRGLLDGHIILDRGIAERGRFPAIDVRKSVSRSLPGIANDDENIDQSIRLWPLLEEFVKVDGSESNQMSFELLSSLLNED